MFQGSMTALVTPMRDGAIDEAAFAKLIDWQISEGTQGLVPVGTTGESPTLSHQEHRRVIELCMEVTAGRVPVIAGAGSNSTQEACELVQFAKTAGADAALVIAPYYNKPTQEGLYQHFKAVALAADIPIMLYNVPGRTVSDIKPETVARVAKDVPNVVGIKDASADLVRMWQHRTMIDCPFCYVSGEDATILGFRVYGGQGCISVTSNVAPRLCAQFHAACSGGDYDEAGRINDLLMPLHAALFVETSPAPVKYALSRLGICAPELRLPMVPVSSATAANVDAAMAHASLI